MDDHDDTTPPVEPASSGSSSPGEPSGIQMGQQERAFFAGMIAAQMASEAIEAFLQAAKDGVITPFAGVASVTVASFAGGGPGTRELAAFFWMTIGAQMNTDVPALIAEPKAASKAGSESESTAGRAARAERQVTELQQVYLHGAMTRAPSWLEPAFELTIPTFDAPPFTRTAGDRIGDEAVRRLIAVALQRTWGRISDGASEGPVHLDNPHDATWVPVGTFRIRDGW